MTARRTTIATLVLFAIGASAAAAPGPHRPRAVSVSVVTQPSQTLAVMANLRARGVRVDRRVGRRLQVVARGAAARQAIANIPGVDQVAIAPSAYGDAVVGQGVDRTGASSLADASDGGSGLKIAIVDLGFGVDVPSLQASGELPPSSRLELRSFDPAGGITGTNAYGNPTNHGELVAQTVYDYAPNARYVFVSYHTPDDFVAAVDWIATQGIDIVVHSNNFLDGPFDGTSAAARAVDRAAAAGVVWFNSAGNYGENHWAGPWTDVDGDGVHEWPGTSPWTVTHDVGQALTFHVTWRNPPGAVRSDVDLVLEQRRPDGTWAALTASRDRQVDGAPPSERIVGVRPLVAAEFRVRLELVSGPPPSGDLHLYAREDDVVSLTGVGDGSTPTPADAAGSISVGAVDYRSNSLVRYSSRGPTADGRPKPELVAPTGTSLATAGGDPRDVGGTSIAAPNAAGAAAVLLGALRSAGIRPTAGEIRQQLARDAIDLGPPGLDTQFGAGRLRVDLEPPEVRSVLDPPRRPVRGTVRVSVDATDAGTVAAWALQLDDTLVRQGRVGRERINASFSTRGVPDGAHTATLIVTDGVGNQQRRGWRIVSDNTAPTVDAVAVGSGPAVRIRESGKLRTRYPVTVAMTARDGIAQSLTVSVRLTRTADGRFATRTETLVSGAPRALAMGALPAGVYVLRVVVTDVAGNVRTTTRPVRVPGRQ